MEFVGVDLSILEANQKQIITDALEVFKIQQAEGYMGPDKYWVPLEQQGDAIGTLGVDEQTVHGRIANVMLEKTGIGSSPEGK